MTIQLAQRDRRVLASGGVLISFLVGLFRGLPALRAWESDRASEARAAAEQLAQIRSVGRVMPELRESLVVRRARLAGIDSSLPAASSPSGVAAAIASILESLAEDNGVKLTTLQLRADTTLHGGRVRASVRMGGMSDITGLAGLLRSIESGETPLVVRDLSVSQPEPAAPDTKPEVLHLDLLIAGIGRVVPIVNEARE